MADIEDLGYPSILDMSNDEAIDLLRQIRLSRRVPEKKVVQRQETTTSTRTKATAAVTSNMAEELLKILGDLR